MAGPVVPSRAALANMMKQAPAPRQRRVKSRPLTASYTIAGPCSITRDGATFTRSAYTVDELARVIRGERFASIRPVEAGEG